jgi:AraC-like DNA-binding protein
LADPSLAYLGGPDDEQSIAHRPGAKDVCTALTLFGSFAQRFPDQPGAFPVTGRVAVCHRLLLAAARRGADPLELGELAVRLVDMLTPAFSQSPSRPATRRAWRALAEAARELLAQDPGRKHGLLDLAGTLGCSPSHLSRVFHHDTGTTLSRYRNRIRALAALEAVDNGACDLAGLAADLGFADHAHLTRTVRQEFGYTPRSLRALLVDGA